MTERRFQAHEHVGLDHPEVSRHVARVTDHVVPGTGFTMDEIQHFQRLGRRLQARAVAATLSGLFRGALRGVSRLGAGFARARREAAAMRQLGALDDRLLADIGISRGQIPAVVAGLESRRSAEDTPVRPVATVTEARPAVPAESSNDAHARKAA